MSAHSSILGGSNAARLLACPASYAEQLRSSVSTTAVSAYADEGTLLHNIIAGMVGGEGTVEVLLTDEQHQVLDRALGTLAELKKQHGGGFRVVAVEKTLPLPGVTGAFGSVDLIMANPYVVMVIDWKFGAGIRVPALYEEPDGDRVNPQLMFYACAARAAHPRHFKNKRIIAAIIQPRFDHALSQVETSHIELNEFQFAFQSAFLEALGRDPHRERGEHCRFAPCKATCPLWVGPALDLALIDPQAAAMKTSVTGNVTEYGQFLSHALDLANLAETWAKTIREQAHVFLEDGGKVPNWKIVPKRATRKWLDEETTAAELAAIGADDADIWSEPTLRSVAQVEKALKPRGLSVPDDLYHAVSSGTTIAPDDDPRSTIDKVTVTKEFRNALTAL